MPISAEMGRPSSTSRGSMPDVVSSAMRRGMKEMVMSMARMKTNISGRNRASRLRESSRNISTMKMREMTTRVRMSSPLAMRRSSQGPRVREARSFHPCSGESPLTEKDEASSSRGNSSPGGRSSGASGPAAWLEA